MGKYEYQYIYTHLYTVIYVHSNIVIHRYTDCTGLQPPTDESVLMEEAEDDIKMFLVFSVVAAEDEEVVDVDHLERDLNENCFH